MKNLYSKSKSKIKIHPSPTPPLAAVKSDALAVLSLLPAAILTLTAALSLEDKEVIAYLMICSINGSGSTAAEDRRRCRMIAGVHRPLFDCSCFDCYTSFWSRWDCSRDREMIHLVIEAFEEHLAMKEQRKVKESKRKRKKNPKEAKNQEKAEILEPAAAEAEENKGVDGEVVSVRDGCFVIEAEAEAVERVETGEAAEVESPPASDDKKRGWVDVMGIFNSRLWSLWGPGV